MIYQNLVPDLMLILQSDDIFSIGRKIVTSMLINDEQLIVACSDGNIRIFNLVKGFTHTLSISLRDTLPVEVYCIPYT